MSNFIKNTLLLAAGVAISAAAIKSGKEFGSAICNSIEGNDPKSFKLHYAKIMAGVDTKEDYKNLKNNSLD